MKSYLAVPVGVMILAAVLATGGCVSREEYAKLERHNEKMNDRLNAALAESQRTKTQNAQLQQTLGQRETELETCQSKVAVLTEANDDLAAKIEGVKDQLRKVVEGMKPPPLLPIKPLPALVDKKLQAFASGNPELMDYLPEYGMVKLKGDLTFEKGSDFVRAKASETLKRFVEIVNAREAAAFHIFVAGHTDDIPIEDPDTRLRHPDNWYLSVHRAVAVQQELEKAALSPERICAMGFGEYHPVAPNAPNKRGNALNRRVEIWIVPADRFVTSPAGK